MKSIAVVVLNIVHDVVFDVVLNVVDKVIDLDVKETDYAVGQMAQRWKKYFYFFKTCLCIKYFLRKCMIFYKYIKLWEYVKSKIYGNII